MMNALSVIHLLNNHVLGFICCKGSLGELIFVEQAYSREGMGVEGIFRYVFEVSRGL